MQCLHQPPQGRNKDRLSAPAGRVLSMSVRGRKSPGMRHCVTGNHQPNDITMRTSDLTDSKRLAGILLLTAFWDPQDLCSSVLRPGVNNKEKCLCCDILGALESANTWYNLKRLYRIFLIVGLLATAHAAATLQPMTTFTQQHSVQQ